MVKGVRGIFLLRFFKAILQEKKGVSSDFLKAILQIRVRLLQQLRMREGSSGCVY